MITTSEEKSGLIIGLTAILVALVKNREHIRVAIIASRIKEGSEVRLMSKQIISLSQEIVDRDRVISGLVMELEQVKRNTKENKNHV